jgi:hypothetical protein
VLTKKRNRRSLFQRPLPRTDCSVRGRGPQGPRRPRFSFFRFTCQTARDHGDPLPGGRRAVETPNLRPRSEAGHRISVRSFGGAPSHRGGGAPCGAYIGPPLARCQHPVGENRPELPRELICLCTAIYGAARAGIRGENSRESAAAPKIAPKTVQDRAGTRLDRVAPHSSHNPRTRLQVLIRLGAAWGVRCRSELIAWRLPLWRPRVT